MKASCDWPNDVSFTINDHVFGSSDSVSVAGDQSIEETSLVAQCFADDPLPEQFSRAFELTSRDVGYLYADSFEREIYPHRYFAGQIVAPGTVANKNFSKATMTACDCNGAASAEPGKYMALAPFLGALIFLQGCSAAECGEADCENECRAYNDTTILLNRQTDGKIPTINDIAATFDGTISEPLADLVNEAHVLSTGGMPEDVKVTIAPKSCFEDRYAYAHSQKDSSRGVYVQEPVTMDNLSVLDHEIGHLQKDGAHNETIAEFNVLEQKVMRYALFSAKYSIPDFLEWMRHDRMALPEETRIKQGEYNEYSQSDLWILFELLANGGDFGKTRTRIEQLEETGALPSALDLAKEQYLNTYSPDIYGGSEPWTDVRLALMMSSHNEIFRRFDQETADFYFNAMQYSLIYNYENSAIGPAFGLDGYNCLMTRGQASRLTRNVHQTCAGVSATMEIPVSLDLCCYNVDNSSPEGQLNFRKWAIDAHGYICATWLADEGGTPAEPLVLPQEFGTQYSSTFVVIDTQEELLLHGYCK